MKGQLGIETIMALTVLSFFLLGITVYYISQNRDIVSTETYLEASRVCFDLKNAIDVSASGRNNATINFTLPQKLGTKNYSAYVESDNRVVRIALEDYSYTCPIFSNVTNTTHSSFAVGKGLNMISNRDGLITIQKS